MTRLADHHDGAEPPRRATSPGALRVFDHHIEIDIVVAADHTVTATTAALRAALCPLVADRAVHVTVIDVDTLAARPDARGGSDLPPASRTSGVAEPLDRARAVARAVLAHLEAQVAEGLAATHHDAVTGICRTLTAFDVDPVSRRVLVRRLRRHLTGTCGPIGPGLVYRLEAIEDIDDKH
ncbi:hypothetical protein [Actinomycetospora chiangmaiensis]|uniref:hypothetical protein n=1 Tax=Actinomycetospora chiangmaiensis TaxID=402650 RepID=UPI000370D87F|nr:hypothetical protein [Actinomycetospora chiangmaiensis]